MRSKESKPIIDIDIHILDGEKGRFSDEYYIVAMKMGDSEPNYFDVQQFFSLTGTHRPIGLITLEHFVGSKMASIQTMDVDYQYEGRKVGQRLMARAAIFAKELGAESMHTNSVDTAVGFYRKQGMTSEPWNPKSLEMSLIDDEPDD